MLIDGLFAHGWLISLEGIPPSEQPMDVLHTVPDRPLYHSQKDIEPGSAWVLRVTIEPGR